MSKIKWFSIVVSIFLTFSVHAKQCVRSGCGGNACVDASQGPVNAICVHNECLKKNRCEVQPNGECGWTNPPAYMSCMTDTEQNNSTPSLRMPLKTL